MGLSSICGHKLENSHVSERSSYLGIGRVSIGDRPPLALVINWTDAAHRTTA